MWRSFPAGAVALTLLFLGFLLFPPVRDNSRLAWSFVGVASGLLVWEVILWRVAARRNRALTVEFNAVKSHWVQGCVQFGILLYWGWFWRDVFSELPLILAQLVYFYTLDALFSWSRGRTWKVGFGPLPIVLSTNLLLWFKHDWYFLQFLMLTTGALGKQFITWNREGRRTHIFNPSAFGQSVFAIVLIATGMTNHLTVGREIAATFDPPYMLIVIFLGGLIVQSLFGVTLMTVAATVTVVVLNVIYTEITGVYFFVSVNIAGPIFLGMHLLITDPATSPRTNAGKVLFGALYGLGYMVLFRAFDLAEIPLFWDKLLPVPILNLCVPLIDRFVRTGPWSRFNQTWETILPSKKMNFVHMGFWAAFFLVMLKTGFIEGQHPGNSIPFWKAAYAAGKPHAGHSLVIVSGSQAQAGEAAGHFDAAGPAYNELGLICMEGKIVNESRGSAARYFAKACELGNEEGCINVALQFLGLHEKRSDEDVARALDLLEADCMHEKGSGRNCFLVGFAYETGRGRPLDPRRAIELYERVGRNNVYAAKGLARIALSGAAPNYDVRPLIATLAAAAQSGDAESWWYLAYMAHDGRGLPRSDQQARTMLGHAGGLGLNQAREALDAEEIPPYANPVIMLPGWATAYPVEEAGASE